MAEFHEEPSVSAKSDSHYEKTQKIHPQMSLDFREQTEICSTGNRNSSSASQGSSKHQNWFGGSDCHQLVNVFETIFVNCSNVLELSGRAKPVLLSLRGSPSRYF